MKASMSDAFQLDKFAYLPGFLCLILVRFPEYIHPRATPRRPRAAPAARHASPAPRRPRATPAAQKKSSNGTDSGTIGRFGHENAGNGAITCKNLQWVRRLCGLVGALRPSAAAVGRRRSLVAASLMNASLLVHDDVP